MKIMLRLLACCLCQCFVAQAQSAPLLSTPQRVLTTHPELRVLLQQSYRARMTSPKSVYALALQVSTAATQIRDTLALIQSYCLLAEIVGDRGSRWQALTYCHNALRLAKVSAQPAALAEAYTQLCESYRLLLYYDSARTAGKRAQHYALQASDSLRYALASASLAQLYVRQQQYSEAMPLFQQALTSFERTAVTSEAYRAEQVVTITRIGYALSMQARHNEALPFYRRALTTVERYGYPVGIAEISYVFGSSLLHLRQFDSAQFYLQRSLALADTLGLVLLKKEVHFHLSQLYEQQEKFAEALAQYRQFATLTDDSIDSVWEIEVQRYEQTLRNQQLLLRQRETTNEQLKQLTIAGGVLLGSAIIGMLIALVRVRTSKRIRERNEELRVLSAYTSDVISRHDVTSGVYRYVSPGIEPLFGYTQQDLIDKDPFLFVHPDDTERVRAVYRQSIYTKSADSVVLRFRTKSGSYRWIEVILKPILNEQGRIVEYINSSRDVSERIEANEKLAASEAMLRATLFNTPNVAVQWYDHDGRVILWNNASEKMFGWQEHEVIGKTLGDINLYVDPNGVQEFRQTLDYITRTGETVGPFQYEFRKKDGSTGYGQSTTFSITSSLAQEAQQQIFVCMDIEITEQKKAELALRENEERLRSIVEALSEGLVVQDKEDKILFSNESAAHILGLTQDQLYGHSSYDPLWRVVHEDGSPFMPDDRPSVTTLRTGKPTANVVMGVYKPDGSLSWISTNAQPIYNESKSDISSVVVTFADITKSKTAELALRESEERLRSIVEAISEGLVLHDSQGRVTLCNPAAAHILGMNEQDLLGITSTAFQKQTVHEDGTPFLPDEYPANYTLRTGEPLSDIIMGIIGHNEPIRWISINSRPLFAQNRTPSNGDSAHSQNGYSTNIQTHQTQSSADVRAVVVTFADITERRKAEQYVREREAQLTGLIESTSDSIYSIDRDYRLKVFNSTYRESARAAFGIDIQPGMSVMSFLPPEREQERVSWKQSFDRVLLGGEQYSLVYAPPFGTEQRFVEIMFNPIRDEEGTITGVVAFNRDITPIKRAEERIRKSEAELRAVIESTTDYIYSVDRSYRLLTYNTAYAQAARQLFGVEIATGMNVLDLQPSHLVNDRLKTTQEHAVWKERFDRCLAGERFSLVYAMTYNGEEQYFEQLYNPIVNEDGTVTGVVAFNRNITQFKQAEERLRRSEELLRRTSSVAQVGGWELDVQSSPPTMQWTETTYHLCGIPPDTPLEVPSVLSMFFTQEQQECFDDFLRTKAHSSKEFTYELSYKAAANQNLWLRIVGNSELANGKVARLYGTLQDITQQREAERMIQEQLHALESKNAEMERFIYTVSHDLKSPLITIKGFLGMIQEDLQMQNYRRIATDLQRIDNAATKMQQLLEDLLELSRIGRVVNPSEHFSLSALAAETVELLHGILSQQNVRVSIQQDMPSVVADKARFREVYQNLIENACKFFGNQQQPHIEIGARHDDIQPIMFVRDNGIGIAKEYHEKIFGLFDKLDQYSEGTGIGLALVKRIIELHGGRIWVESEPGHGATFYFTCKTVTTEQQQLDSNN
jgi:PAS domain S-box-containing protein